MNDLRSISWPVSRVGEAIEVLARRSGLVSGDQLVASAHVSLTGNGVATAHASGGSPPVGVHAEEMVLDDWVDAYTAGLGIEAEPVAVEYANVERFLAHASPVLVTLTEPGESSLLVLFRSQGRRVEVIGPDLKTSWLRLDAVRAALCRSFEAPLLDDTNRLLAEAGVPERQQRRTREAIFARRLAGWRLTRCWRLRPSPGTAFWSQLRIVGLLGNIASLIGAHTVEYLLWVLSWWMVGRAALAGRFDPGWLLAWALVLLTLVPLRLFVFWSEGRVSIGAGGLLKQRLLFGALRLEPEEVRRAGAGQLLGRVIESEAVESLALGGGILAVLALIELVLAMLVLAVGAGGAMHSILLGLWVVLALLGARVVYARRKRWTKHRLGMTQDLVECMVGHRTRLAQEAPEHWHDGEDRGVERYLDSSRAMDRATVLLAVVLPRGWLLVGLAGLGPGFVSGAATPTHLAVGLGGILLAYAAIQKLVQGVSNLTGAAVAWENVRPIYRAASRRADEMTAVASAFAARSSEVSGRQPIMQAHDLVFRYHERGEPVLRGVSVQIYRGDRLLLQGPSGGGKSTLASLLAGLRVPGGGLMLLGGLDRHTLGESAWRRRVVAAPQFHENHVLTETFAFNLLMGRRWPAYQEDLEEAETICRELGLGELLDRMPSGMLQMVGESGWQLSHGERSRLYIARALLQHAELVVLDESFAALDPESMSRALTCVLGRAPTVLVISHP